MFMISNEEIAAIHGALEHGGEFAAVAEAQRMWPALTSAQAQDCVRTIATWKPRASGELPDAKKATP
jgi:proline racemase